MFYLFMLPFAVLVLVFGLWPIAQSVRVAFTESYTALSPTPTYVGLANFREIFADRYFLASLRLTLSYTLAAVVLNITLALAYSLLLGSPLLAFGNLFFRVAVFLPVVTPDVASYVVWKWMYNSDFGVVNAALASLSLPTFTWLSSTSTVFFALLLAELWKHVGFYVIIFITNLKMIDPVYFEAARLDGAGAWQQFRHVTLPQLRPSLTINSVYALVQFLKTFTVVAVITKGGPNFASNFVSYYAYQKFDQAQYGEATAMATVLFTIVLGLALLTYWLNARGDYR